MLATLVYSLSHEALDSYQASDIADVALQMVEQAVVGLDDVKLNRGKDMPEA